MVRRLGPLQLISTAAAESHHKQAKEAYRKASKTANGFMTSTINKVERIVTARALDVERGIPDAQKGQTDRGYRDRALLSHGNVIGATTMRVEIARLDHHVFRFIAIELVRANTAAAYACRPDLPAPPVQPYKMTRGEHDRFLVEIVGDAIHVTPLVGLLLGPSSSAPGLVMGARAQTDVRTGELQLNTFVAVSGAGGEQHVAQLILAFSVNLGGAETEMAYVRYFQDAPPPPDCGSSPDGFVKFAMVNERDHYGSGHARTETVRYEILPINAIEGPVFLMRDMLTTPPDWSSRPEKELKKFRFWRLRSVKHHV